MTQLEIILLILVLILFIADTYVIRQIRALNKEINQMNLRSKLKQERIDRLAEQEAELATRMSRLAADVNLINELKLRIKTLEADKQSKQE